jgi:hypothetical protein
MVEEYCYYKFLMNFFEEEKLKIRKDKKKWSNFNLSKITSFGHTLKESLHSLIGT